MLTEKDKEEILDYIECFRTRLDLPPKSQTAARFAFQALASGIHRIEIGMLYFQDLLDGPAGKITKVSESYKKYLNDPEFKETVLRTLNEFKDESLSFLVGQGYSKDFLTKANVIAMGTEK